MANFNLNKAILGGRLTADPELKQTPNGVFVCQFTVAVTRKANREKTDFINCVAWRGVAELVSKYFRKGSSICIVGNIQTRSWTDSANQKRYATEIIVDDVEFVDSKGETTHTPSAKTSQNAPQSAPAYTAPQECEYEDIDPDDELPF